MKRKTLRQREQASRRDKLKAYFGYGAVDYEEVPYSTEMAMRDSWFAGYRAAIRDRGKGKP